MEENIECSLYQGRAKTSSTYVYHTRSKSTTDDNNNILSQTTSSIYCSAQGRDNFPSGDPLFV